MAVHQHLGPFPTLWQSQMPPIGWCYDTGPPHKTSINFHTLYTHSFFVLFNVHQHSVVLFPSTFTYFELIFMDLRQFLLQIGSVRSWLVRLCVDLSSGGRGGVPERDCCLLEVEGGVPERMEMASPSDGDLILEWRWHFLGIIFFWLNVLSQYQNPSELVMRY